MDDAQKARFWLAVAAVTILNLGIWMFVGTPSGGPTDVRITYSTNAIQFEHSGRLEIRFDRNVFEGMKSTPVVSTMGPITSDPRITGMWYFTLVTTTESGATKLATFCRARGLETYVINADNSRLYRVIALPGSTKRNDAKMAETLSTIHTIGRKWADTSGGRGNDLRDAYPGLKSTQWARDGEKLVRNMARGEGLAQPPFRIDPALEGEWVVRGKDTIAFEPTVPPPGGQYRVMPVDGHPFFDSYAINRHSLPVLDYKPSVKKADPEFEPVPVVQLVQNGIHVRRISANYAWWDDEPSVTLRFDRQLDPTQSEPTITITPDIGAVRVLTSGKSITLTGAFVWGTDYTVIVAPPLLAVDGSILRTSVQRTVTIPEMRPLLKFEANTGRLGTKGAFELAVKAYGMKKAKIRLYKLLDQNIPVFLSGIMSDWEVPKLGQLVSETTVDIPVDPGGSVADLALPLDSLIERLPGVYWVTIEAEEGRWTRDSMLLLVGDLGLDVHTDRTGALAWVTQVETGHGATEVEVVAYSNNRTELARGTTDGDGLIRLELNPAQCALITATRNGELAFVHVKDAKGLDDPKMAGAAWAGPLDIALYADRGVHRPGETLHITGTVRTRNGEVPNAIPLELRLTRPDKRIMQTKIVQTDPEQGMFQLDLPTRPDDPTGNWIITMHVPGDDVVITTIACPIMAFMPVRLKVNASSISADEPGDVLVKASYLHGAPAAGLKTTCSTVFHAVRYKHDLYPDHRFEDPPTTERIKRNTTAMLNDNGHQAFNIETPPHAGTWRGDVETTVVELGGRATTARTQIHRQTADLHLGLRSLGGALHDTDESIAIDAVVLDGQGELRNATTIKAHLFSVSHSWQLVSVGKGKRRWKSVEITQPVRNVEPTFTTGPANSHTCTLPPLPIGAYRVVASAEQATVGLDLHVSDHEARGRMSADQPDRLELIAEDETVRPGMQTSVLIRSGFPGVALFTVETDTIEHWELVEITGDGLRVPFVVPESVRDTCFVGATLLRPLDPTRTEWLPLRARGATRLQVDLDAHELEVNMTGATSAKPGDLVTFTLDVPQRGSDENSPTPLVHLWAVDEGALLATNWSVPNLLAHFLQDRRRAIATVGTTEQLLADFERPVSTARIGGDASRRFREPVPVRQLETAVLWRTIQPLPQNGILQVELPMPKIDGAMRIMAVIVDGDRFGNARHLVAVQAPLQWVAATPRTAAPGDVMSIPVRLQNNTDTTVTVHCSLSTGDELHGRLSDDSLHIPAGSETSTTLILAAAAVGSGNLELLATPVDENITLKPARLLRSIAVRPPHGRKRNVHRMRVDPGETVQINRDRSLEAMAGHITIVAGGLPTLDLKPAFDELVSYPYGCAEQTSSRTEGLLAALNLPESVSGTPHTLLQEWASAGLQKLYRMQRYDGGLPYWRTSKKANDWVTLRTAIIALKAQSQGVEPPAYLLRGLLTYAARIARPARSKSNNDLAALACRVLARGDVPDKALIATLASNLEKLNLEGRAHLADACAAIGDMKTAETIIASFSAPETLKQDDGVRLSSSVHQCAVALEVLTRIAPEHPIAVEFVRYIDNARKIRGWRTTYENAAAISALSSWHELQNLEGVAQGRVQIAGRIIDIDSNKPVNVSFDVKSNDSQTETITSSGDAPITVLVLSSGIPLDAQVLPIKMDQIHITRTWRNSAGVAINMDDPVAAGDLITVDLEVRSTSGLTYRNVAIVDVLPGGMEFELPSLATSAKRDTTRIVNVDQVEFRDDRLLVFASLDDKPRRLRYLMRAIVPGTWAVPAPDALSMYDPDAHGRGAAGIVEITLQ